MNKNMIVLFIGCLMSISAHAYDSRKAFTCVNVSIQENDNNSLSFTCDRCDETKFMTLQQLITHKHDPRCISNRECVDCRLNNVLRPQLFKNSKEAIDHIRNAHANTKIVHCFLCGLRVYQDEYRNHLKNPTLGLFTKENNNNDIPTQTQSFSLINNALYKDE